MRFTMNRERLMADAKAKALERVREGYHVPAPRLAHAGRRRIGDGALNLGVHLMWRAGRASDHDKLIGQKLAHIFGAATCRMRPRSPSSTCSISSARHS
jgi:3-hydroxyacyl-CoA dehydrogenase